MARLLALEEKLQASLLRIAQRERLLEMREQAVSQPATADAASAPSQPANPVKAAKKKRLESSRPVRSDDEQQSASDTPESMRMPSKKELRRAHNKAGVGSSHPRGAPPELRAYSRQLAEMDADSSFEKKQIRKKRHRKRMRIQYELERAQRKRDEEDYYRPR
eukprot:2262520-Pleurochrysis_carterae.AAC.1